MNTTGGSIKHLGFLRESQHRMQGAERYGDSALSHASMTQLRSDYLKCPTIGPDIQPIESDPPRDT